MSALGIYTGSVTAGSTDGNLVNFDGGKILLSGYRDKTTAMQTLALRARAGSDYPVVNLHVSVTGPKSDWYLISMDGSNFVKSLAFPYICKNVLLYVKAVIPEDADYGLLTGNYLKFDYLGGV